jgi:hypothetical protein
VPSPKKVTFFYGNKSAKLDNLLAKDVVRIQFGSPHWKDSELFFEKKQLIQALQQLLA